MKRAYGPIKPEGTSQVLSVLLSTTLTSRQRIYISEVILSKEKETPPRKEKRNGNSERNVKTNIFVVTSYGEGGEKKKFGGFAGLRLEKIWQKALSQQTGRDIREACRGGGEE